MYCTDILHCTNIEAGTKLQQIAVTYIIENGIKISVDYIALTPVLLLSILSSTS